MSTSMRVRECRENDFADWSRMRKMLWPDCSDEINEVELRLIAESAGNYVVLLLVDENDRACGFAEVSIRERVDGAVSERVGYLEGWFVGEPLRAKGYGRRLVEAGEAWARSKGMIEFGSDTETDNDVSISAHHALGFRETFRLVHFLKRLDESPPSAQSGERNRSA